MKRMIAVSFAAALFSPDSFAGQPLVAKGYGEWTMMGIEDPMDGWSYTATIDVPSLTTMPFPYRNATMTVTWSCPEERAFFMMKNAPRIGRLLEWHPPASWYFEWSRKERYLPNDLVQETLQAAEERRRIRIRWDQEEPEEVTGGLHENGRLFALFFDPLYAGKDTTALRTFVADLSKHSTLLIEIRWSDPQLPRSHFRVPLNGATEAIEDAKRRCSDTQKE